MAQGTISAAQTPLLVSDFINRAKADNTALALGSPDFLTPFKIVLPAYAAAYSGPYYQVPSQTSAPTAFGSAKYAAAYGNIYEVAIPTDAIDNGVTSVTFVHSTNQIVPEAKITNGDESTWDMTNTNSDQAYWEQKGRTVRTYLPIAYSTSTPKYSFGYQREPTYPQVTGDAIDAPAEDIGTLYSSWLSEIKVY